MIEQMIELYNRVSIDLIEFRKIIDANFPENEFYGPPLQELKSDRDNFTKEWYYDKLEYLKRCERQIYFLLDYVEFNHSNEVNFLEFNSDLILEDFTALLYGDLFEIKERIENSLQGYVGKRRPPKIDKSNKRQNEETITQNQSALLYRYFQNELFNCKQKDWTQAIAQITGLQPNERVFSEIEKNSNTQKDLAFLSQKLKRIIQKMDEDIKKQ